MGKTPGFGGILDNRNTVSKKDQMFFEDDRGKSFKFKSSDNAPAVRLTSTLQANSPPSQHNTEASEEIEEEIKTDNPSTSQ